MDQPEAVCDKGDDKHQSRSEAFRAIFGIVAVAADEGKIVTQAVPLSGQLARRPKVSLCSMPCSIALICRIAAIGGALSARLAPGIAIVSVHLGLSITVALLERLRSQVRADAQGSRLSEEPEARIESQNFGKRIGCNKRSLACVRRAPNYIRSVPQRSHFSPCVS